MSPQIEAAFTVVIYCDGPPNYEWRTICEEVGVCQSDYPRHTREEAIQAILTFFEERGHEMTGSKDIRIRVNFQLAVLEGDRIRRIH